MIRLPVQPRAQWALLALVAALSVLMYLAASLVLFRIGFPLDDAWIHQTYARNLAQRGEWAFQPGQPSAGSTAPLWSLWLSLGHLLHIGPYAWAFLSGWVCLVAVAWQGSKIFHILLPQRQYWVLWVALFLTLEYHLVWAAASGMETLLIASLVLAVFVELFRPAPRFARVGIFIGLSLWVRPDGITLLGPAIWALAFNSQTWGRRWRSLQSLVIGVGGFVLLYIMFNLWLSGNWLPNTFFAKQSEYAILRQTSIWYRLSGQFGQMLVGAGVLLLPGLILFISKVIRQRHWVALGIVFWLFGYLLLYALRLPVVYQHGRYIIPAMPVYFVCSLCGLGSFVQFNIHFFWKRVLGKAWSFAVVMVLLAFWVIGAQAYARDVAIIESEMVTVAHWIQANTAPQAVVAAHDIGALGYFSQRQLLDLAGLVSPQVIPFIRDEARLYGFLHENHADYLVTFPGWYPHLVIKGILVFETQAKFSPASGGENMAVYDLR